MLPLTRVDDLVKEFLLFRGFAQTFKAFEAEIKAEKDKGLRVDKIIDLIMQHISNHDLTGLRDLWSHLQQKVFSRLDPQHAQAVPKLESSLFKLYLVHCVQNKRMDRVRDFFEKMTPELQTNPEWKDWFALPFVNNADSNPTFSTQFSRQWQDSLMLSLFNFLSIVFSCLPPPRLVNYHSSLNKIRRLKEENENFRQKLVDLNSLLRRTTNLTLADIKFPDALPPEEIMDDFFTIAQEAPSNEGHAKTLKSFLKNITGVAASSSMQQSQVERRIHQSSSASKILSSSLKQGKSRSSSKSRLSSTTTTVNQPPPSLPQQQSTHQPVTRISLSRPTSSSSLLLKRMSPSRDTATEKMAYLLLGQEEYLEHSSEITQCKFSSSGSVIASSDVSGVIKVWSSTPPVPETKATFISQDEVSALDWLPHSDRHFVYGTKSGLIRLCDNVERKTTSETVPGNPEGKICVHNLTCSPNSGMLAASVSTNTKESLFIYDLKTMTSETDLNMLPAPLLTSCIFNHNSQMVIAAGVDSKVRIFDLRKQDCLLSWQVHDTDPILNIALSNDETAVYAITSGGSFSGWSMYQSGQKLFEFQLDDSYFSPDVYPRSSYGRTIAFAGDGKHMLTCSTNGGVIYEFSSSSVNKVLGLKAHRQYATCADWSSVSNCGPCITAAKDGHIRVSTLLRQ